MSLKRYFWKQKKSQKKKASVKQIDSKNDIYDPTFPSFESLSQKYKVQFKKHFIDCYPSITEVRLA